MCGLTSLHLDAGACLLGEGVKAKALHLVLSLILLPPWVDLMKQNVGQPGLFTLLISHASSALSTEVWLSASRLETVSVASGSFVGAGGGVR